MLRRLIFAAIVFSLLSACSSQQTLFSTEINEVDNYKILQTHFHQQDPILKPGDKITLSIWGHEDLSIGSVNSKFSSNKETGKWIAIDHLGEVNLPKLGRIKIAGYNLKEVNYLLEEQYSTYLKDPIVNVRTVNHYVTVIGEVNSPGKYALDNEKVNLVQILGQAKGLGDYSNNKRIKVIREVNGQAIELLVDMTDIIATTEYNITLQSKDIVYVEPSKEKAEDSFLKKVTPVASLITGGAVLLSVLLK